MAVALALALSKPGPVVRFDLHLYDYLSALTRPSQSNTAVILDIDDESVAEIGPWPWPRRVHATLLDTLSQNGVHSIAFDLLLSDPAGDDEKLAAAMRRFGHVVLAVAPTPTDPLGGIAPVRPAPLLAEVATLGHADVERDIDGLSRRIFLKAGTAQTQWPALALAIAAKPSAVAGDSMRITSSHRWIQEGEVLLPNPVNRSIPRVSYARVLREPVIAASLQDRGIFVGVTATGITGALATPSGLPMPAVEFHARAYDALQTNQIARLLPTSFTLTLSAVFVLLPLLFRRWLSTFGTVAITSLCLLVPLGASWLLLHGLHWWFTPLAAMGGIWVAGTTVFVRQLQQMQRHLAHSRRNAEATLNAIADAVINVGADGHIRSMNPIAAELAAPSEGRVGQHIVEALALDSVSARQLTGMIESCAVERRTIRAEQWLDLNLHHLRVTAGPIIDEAGRVHEIVLAFTDVTETVAATAKLYHDATHDSLTGLPNRTLLMRQIAEAISRAMQRGGLTAVMFIDIDHFNRINDSLGHHTGDAILVETARRLAQAVGSENQVSRWGGDEYVVLCGQPRDREAIAEIAQGILQSTGRPVVVNSMTLHVTCSIGIALAPTDSIDVDELLAMADAAMARTKAEVEGGYRFFSRSMTVWSRAQIDIETDLRRALQNNEFDLHFQPQIEVSSGKLVGMEALLRWERPGSGVVMPDHFIPVAEEIGLIIDIGVWAIYRAAQQLRQWQDAGLSVVPLAVNVSARQCLDHRITQVIADALTHTRINPALLKIELTETTAMNNVDHVASLLRSVHALGVRISVDDFGTGYSSLSFLKRFPISQLKIDRSFVQDIAIDADDAAIVTGTIALAHGLGIEVVAEGVENQEQLDFLAARHCDIAQGYHFSRPLNEADARELLRSAAKAESDAERLKQQANAIPQ